MNPAETRPYGRIPAGKENDVACRTRSGCRIPAKRNRSPIFPHIRSGTSKGQGKASINQADPAAFTLVSHRAARISDKTSGPANLWRKPYSRFGIRIIREEALWIFILKVLALPQISSEDFHFLTRQSRSQSPHPSTTRRIDAAADMHVSFSGRGGRPAPSGAVLRFIAVSLSLSRNVQNAVITKHIGNPKTL